MRTHQTEKAIPLMDSFSQSGREMCFCHRVTSLIKSESVIVSAYQIIMVNKLWVYLACIYISPPSSPPLPPLRSLSMILFVSQCLANFALGCNFGSQENAPLLHNLVSRATVVIQLQSETPWGVNPQSDAVQMKCPLIPQPFKCNELSHPIAVHKREHWVQSPTKWMKVNSWHDKCILGAIQDWEYICKATVLWHTLKEQTVQHHLFTIRPNQKGQVNTLT